MGSAVLINCEFLIQVQVSTQCIAIYYWTRDAMRCVEKFLKFEKIVVAIAKKDAIVIKR
jgi:hypothetical protein